MIKDFIVADSVGIQVGPHYADLHNDYDFVRACLRAADATVEVEFSLRTDLKGSSHPDSITLRFVGVDWFQTSPGIALRANKDLVELGYKHADDIDHDWILGEDQATPNSHLFFRLPGDEFIRIHARRATVLMLSQ